jgi:pimeloyl-ACP methyl ester carboxylesterase
LRSYLASVLALVLICSTPDLNAGPGFDLEDCELGGSGGLARIEARCGWFERLENPSDTDSATIFLKVAVIPALSPNPKPDAFTVINGGPGGSSIDMYADSADVFTRIHRYRDILVVDQRGTGQSNPLDCPELETINTEFDEETVQNATRTCLAQLTGDPRYYTTSVAVRDLEAVRLTLGYDSLNVYGVSYGTRVAQHYARRFPQSIRTLIIDGVVPADVPLGPNAALNAQRTLDRLLDRCAEDRDCSGQFPDLKPHLTALSERLRESAVPMEFAHPITGVQEILDLSYPHLVLTLRMMSYAPETIALLPLVIEEAYGNNNYIPMAANALRIINEVDGAIRYGMHNSVVCSEDIPFLGTVDDQALGQTYMGKEQVQALKTICALWPTGPVDDDLREALSTNVPTLILSGEEDPITPPLYGDMAAEHLPNSVHLTATGQGHGVMSRGCIPRLIAEFVETTDPAALDTACLERLAHPAFFLNLMGPSP